MFKAILKNFDISFISKNQDLVEQLTAFV